LGAAPLKVVKTGRVPASECNITGHTTAGSNVKARVTTVS
jgi:hypothetical protein